VGLIELLAGSPAVLQACAAILGLLVGSFLNVVALRLPVMMERAWRRECAELLGTGGVLATEERLSLLQPPSRCPRCGHAIRAWENVPVLSWLILRGRCSACRQPISIRYPVVEALTGLLSWAVAWQLGWSFPLAAALPLTWALVALTVIDIDHQLLPDQITLPFLWLGLLLNAFGAFTDPVSAILGAVAGYLSLWTVYQVFKRLTGKEGMGYGDFKLLALFGAWLGWQMLPQIVLISALVGSVVGVTLIALRRHERSVPIPFGPYLAAAGWIALLWGEQINAEYLRLTGIG
jgi:leader peptidase (prepilin peptidase) / N-methyltransferase